MKRVLLEPAYVLHRRPYRETSFLVELLTPQHGRITAVAKGVRKARSSMQGLLQPFVPLLVSWAGKTELVALAHAEPRGAVTPLKGACLFAGFYLNELITGLLHKWDAQPSIFADYEAAVMALQSVTLDETVLRTFELRLIEALGYGLLPTDEVTLQKTVVADYFYRFLPEQGLLPCDWVATSTANTNVFAGKSLLAIAKRDWREESTRQDAKRLTRFILQPLLGTKTLHSRRLFIPLADTTQTVANEEVLS